MAVRASEDPIIRYMALGPFSIQVHVVRRRQYMYIYIPYIIYVYIYKRFTRKTTKITHTWSRGKCVMLLRRNIYTPYIYIIYTYNK